MIFNHNICIASDSLNIVINIFYGNNITTLIMLILLFMKSSYYQSNVSRKDAYSSVMTTFGVMSTYLCASPIILKVIPFMAYFLHTFYTFSYIIILSMARSALASQRVNINMTRITILRPEIGSTERSRLDGILSQTVVTSITSVTEEICPICRETYALQDRCRGLTCGHSFHLSCIDMWLRQNFSCPVCRQEFTL